MDERRDGETRDRVDELLDQLQQGVEALEAGRVRNRKSIRKMWGAVLALTVGGTIAIALGLETNGDRIDDNAAIVEKVQQSRVESVLSSCEEQNARNANTIAALDLLLTKVPADQRERARESRAGTVLLINALAPKRDCAKRAARLTTLNLDD